jgi:hypothetical protein
MFASQTIRNLRKRIRLEKGIDLVMPRLNKRQSRQVVAKRVLTNGHQRTRHRPPIECLPSQRKIAEAIVVKVEGAALTAVRLAAEMTGNQVAVHTHNIARGNS